MQKLTTENICMMWQINDKVYFTVFTNTKLEFFNVSSTNFHGGKLNCEHFAAVVLVFVILLPFC